MSAPAGMVLLPVPEAAAPETFAHLQHQLQLVNSAKATALHTAAFEDRASDAARLLSTTPEWKNRPAQFGWTPLHYAARAGSNSVVKLLLQARVDVDAVSMNGRTAIHSAADAGLASTVGILVDAGADVNIQDKVCITATLCAMQPHTIASAPARGLLAGQKTCCLLPAAAACVQRGGSSGARARPRLLLEGRRGDGDNEAVRKAPL